MRPIPLKLREQMELDQEMHVCVYDNGDCRNENGSRPARAEWEHCFTYAGKQINEWWAIIGACWYHHRGPGLNKNYNRYRALYRMNENDLAEAQKKYPKVNWRELSQRLINQFEK